MYFTLKFKSLAIRNKSRREEEAFMDSDTVYGKVKFSQHREVLRLKTGGEFSHSDESVEASISITLDSNRSEIAEKGVGLLSFLGPIKGSEDYEDGYAGQIMFSVFVTNDHFSKLIRNIQSGIYPSGVTLELFDRFEGPIKYKGFGDHMIWDNEDKKNRDLPIQEISFDYDIIEEVFDEDSQKEISILGKTISEKSDPSLNELSLIRKRIDKSNTIIFLGFVIVVIALIAS